MTDWAREFDFLGWPKEYEIRWTERERRGRFLKHKHTEGISKGDTGCACNAGNRRGGSHQH